MTPRAPVVPRLTLVEMAWRMRSLRTSTRILECGVYRIDTGWEVRAGYSPDILLRSQLCATIDIARACADAWRQTVVAKGGFEDVMSPGDPAA